MHSCFSSPSAGRLPQAQGGQCQSSSQMSILNDFFCSLCRSIVTCGGKWSLALCETYLPKDAWAGCQLYCQKARLGPGWVWRKQFARVCARQILHRQIFAPADLVLPTYFYMRRLWHQGRFAPKPPSFYTKKHLYDLLHAGPSLGCKRVVLNNFCTKRPVHQECSFTKELLHQNNFSDRNFYTQNLLTPEASCIRGIFPILFTRVFVHDTFSNQKTCAPNFAYTRNFLRRRTFAREPPHTRNLLQQKRFATKTFYGKKLLQQKSFTPTNFAKERNLSANTPNMKQLLHRKASKARNMHTTQPWSHSKLCQKPFAQEL